MKEPGETDLASPEMYLRVGTTREQIWEGMIRVFGCGTGLAFR